MNDMPVVVFLIPFASKRVKSKWEKACIHLRQTLKSIQNSTNGNFNVVVAGHEAPDFDVGLDSRFAFLGLNHPIPKHENPNVAGRLDKLTKIAAAWNYAKSKSKPRYVMKLDADDFISSKLVDWVHNANGEAGYLIKHGWFWQSEARYFCLFIMRRENQRRITHIRTGVDYKFWSAIKFHNHILTSNYLSQYYEIRSLCPAVNRRRDAFNF